MNKEYIWRKMILKVILKKLQFEDVKKKKWFQIT